MYNGASIYFVQAEDTLKVIQHGSADNLHSSTSSARSSLTALLRTVPQQVAKARIFEWAVSLALKWEPEHATGILPLETRYRR